MAQAAFFMTKTARYIKDMASNINNNMTPAKPLPVILAGDYNSQPISSGMSVLYGEEIIFEESNKLLAENRNAWKVPIEVKQREKDIYRKL